MRSALDCWSRLQIEEEMATDEDVVLTPQNVMDYQGWLGHLAARAIQDRGAVTFFVDSSGEIRMEIPERDDDESKPRGDGT